MKNSFKPMFNLTLVAALALSLSGCSLGDSTSEPTTSPNSSAAPSVQPTTQPTVSPDTKPSESSPPAPSPSPTKNLKDVPEIETIPEAKQAAEQFPDVVGDERASTKEIQLALLSSQRYVNDIYNSGYLSNGSWFKKGADSQELAARFGNNWSDSYRGKIEALVDKTKSKDEEESGEAIQELLIHIFYLKGSDSGPDVFKVPESCDDNNLGAKSCLLDGNLEFLEEVSYTTGPDGKIFIDFEFTANLLLDKELDKKDAQKLGKKTIQGISAFNYTIQLEMIKNPYPDAENMRFAYVVNDLGGNWNLDKWQERE